MPSIIWIMRHGLAANDFDTDFNRPLSNTGYAQAKSVAEQILEDGLLPDKLIVSPFRRTQQTADQVVKTLAYSGTRESEELFVHFADYELAANYLTVQNEDKVMVISHMPIVARMSCYLDQSCNIQGFQTAQAVKFCKNDSNQFTVDKIYLPA